MCKHDCMSWDQAGLHWNILNKGARWPLRPEKRTNRWKPTFLCDWEPCETDERRMEGDRELHDSLTAEVVCGNLRNRRWDQFSKPGGFGTTGDSSACPYYLYNLVHSPFLPSPFRSCIKVWSYHMREQYRRREKRMRVSEESEGGRKLQLFGHKALKAKRRSHCKTLCFFNQPTAGKQSKTENCEEAGMLNLGTWGEIKE